MAGAGTIKYKSLDHLKFYKEKINFYSVLNRTYKRRANAVATVRMLLFVIVVACIFFFKNQNGWLLSAIIVAGLMLFIYLVKLHEAIKKQIRYSASVKKLNEIEVEALFHKFDELENGSDYNDVNHAFSLDLDIFGKGSLFQMLVRPGYSGGQSALANMLKNPIVDVNKLFLQQEAVNDLIDRFDFRQKFWATSMVSKGKEEAKDFLLNWNTRCFTKSSWRLVLYWAYSLLTISLLLLGLFDVLSYISFIAVALGGLFINVLSFKRIMRFHNGISKLKSSLDTYSKLLDLLEAESFRSPVLEKLQPANSNHGVKASVVINKLVKQIDQFDYRNNILIGVVLNALFLWDFQVIDRIDKWLDINTSHFAEWIDSLEQIDALMYLSNFAFNHPNYCFPAISGTTIVNAKEMGHPLIPEYECVTNDFELSGEGRLVVVTGANMSGKSTFLRTVGVNLVLAGCGAPVFAKTFEYVPMSILTNMRTTDSLSKHESYFFAELKRLKVIVDTLKNEKPLFIIIDEMLKGTNSKDKAFGSMELVRQLVGMPAYGLIATHDLELGDLAKEYDGKILNKCFEVVHDLDDIVFDYLLRSGVTTVHNATFLMKKMGIIPKLKF